VRDNTGGGVLIDGAAFTIKNTRVSGNGPGQFGPTSWGGILILDPSSGSGLERVSVVDNQGPGVSCAIPVEGIGVFATGNPVANIAPTCQITSCSPQGPTCGAP